MPKPPGVASARAVMRLVKEIEGAAFMHGLAIVGTDLLAINRRANSRRDIRAEIAARLRRMERREP